MRVQLTPFARHQLGVDCVMNQRVVERILRSAFVIEQLQPDGFANRSQNVAHASACDGRHDFG